MPRKLFNSSPTQPPFHAIKNEKERERESSGQDGERRVRMEKEEKEADGRCLKKTRTPRLGCGVKLRR